MDPQQRFAALAEELAGRPGVDPPGTGRGFGSSALKAGGSIFAMLVGDRLVVKLPAAAVAAHIAAGTGGPFDAGKGRPMREWLTVLDEHAWSSIGADALEFARSRQR